MPQIQFSVLDFRVLKDIEWSPEGVCLLAGANGSGKTTVLNALEFFRTFFLYGSEVALADGHAFKRLDAPLECFVKFAVEVDDIAWELHFPSSSLGPLGQPMERLRRRVQGHYQDIFSAKANADTFAYQDQSLPREDARSCAKIVWDRGDEPWMRPLVNVLENIRTYRSYWLNQVKNIDPIRLSDSFLHGTGKNLWSVLSNWQSAPTRYRGQFEWVVNEARQAFPDVMGRIEFDRGLPYLFPPNASDPADGLFPVRAADGLLTGLLHLTAVAGAKSGSVIAFDEIENHLHPHAIRSLLSSMQHIAEEKDLTIILTTHSPVVMNALQAHPEQFFIIDRRFPKSPRSLLALHGEDALLQVSLGELFDQLGFAAPDLSGRG
jgi:predicted ATPase